MGRRWPRSFDCSGLTSYAYPAAGVSVPHSSRSRAQMSRSVAKPVSVASFDAMRGDFTHARRVVRLVRRRRSPLGEGR